MAGRGGKKLARPLVIYRIASQPQDETVQQDLLIVGRDRLDGTPDDIPLGNEGLKEA